MKSSPLAALTAFAVATASISIFSCGGGSDVVDPLIAAVQMTPTSTTLLVGGTAQLEVTVFGKTGPLDNPTVTWESDASNIVSVVGSGLTATATARAAGSARITATAGDKSASAVITVSTVPVASLTLSDRSISLVVGSTKQLQASTLDAAGAVLAGRQIAWKSLDSSIASVSAGLVTGRAVGSTRIVATAEGRTDTATVAVTPVPVASVIITPATPADILVGATMTLTASTRDASNNPLTGRTITWGSGDDKIASVNGGVVTGVAAGSTKITAASEGKSTSVDIRVLPLPVQMYTIRVSATTGGAATGGGTFPANTTVTVTASAAPNYDFVGWTEGSNVVVSPSTSYSFAVTRDRDLVANFNQRPAGTFSLNVGGIGTGNGTVSAGSSPAPISGGINCTITAGTPSGPCNATYSGNSTVTLTALPATNHTFGGFSGVGCSGTGLTCQVSMTQNLSVAATFTAPAPQTVTVNTSSQPAAGGTTSGGGTVPSGSSVTVTAQAASGYSFTNWTENGGVVSTSASYTFTATISRNLVANFAQTSGGGPYAIQVSANPPSSGTLTGAGTYPSGATVNMSATANSGFRFVSWTENGTVVSSSPSFSFQATKNTTLVANFVATASLTVQPISQDDQIIDSFASGSVSGTGGINCTMTNRVVTSGSTCTITVDVGSSVQLTASPATYNQFNGWSGSGCTGIAACTVTVAANTSVQATFQRLKYPVTVAVTGTGSIESFKLNIDCGSCSVMWYGGAPVDFRPSTIAISNWVLSSWGDACAGQPRSGCGVTITGATRVSATFLLQTLPTTTTGASSNVTANSATITGCINGTTVVTGVTFSAQVYFEYGTSATLSGASSTATTSQLLDGVTHCPTATLSGLTSKTTYYYRIVSWFSSPFTMNRGSILSFTTN